MPAAEFMAKVQALTIGGIIYVLLLFFGSAIHNSLVHLVIFPIVSGFPVLYVYFASTEAITKILALCVGGACFILMVFFSPSLNVSAARFLLYPIFTGFVVLYIAFAISVFLGRDTDVELNSVWALYGVAAYIAVGTVCILMFKNADTTEAILGVIAGSISYLMAAVLVVDVVVLQND